ncbi:hypothetical protein C8J57DRAFT_1711965 [Mycena rebaudengoi]|nr:hypothetical protein C8J57DRAFT_1711965 [Mycena rebaudengoi]
MYRQMIKIPKPPPKRRVTDASRPHSEPSTLSHLTNKNKIITICARTPTYGLLRRHSTVTISRDAHFQLDETIDGFPQEVDKAIDANGTALGPYEGSRVNEADGGDND